MEEHERRRVSSEAKGEQDFIDIMLSVLDGKELEGYDVDTINKATCLVRSPFSLLSIQYLNTKNCCLKKKEKKTVFLKSVLSYVIQNLVFEHYF